MPDETVAGQIRPTGRNLPTPDPRSYQGRYQIVTVHTHGDSIVLPHWDTRPSAPSRGEYGLCSRHGVKKPPIINQSISQHHSVTLS